MADLSSAAATGPTLAADTDVVAQRCAVCEQTFASRSALFRHLGTSGCVPGFKGAAATESQGPNYAISFGYYGGGGDVEEALCLGLGVRRLHSRVWAGRGDMALRSEILGAGAWGDVACYFSSDKEHEQAVRGRLALANARREMQVEALRIVKLPVTRGKKQGGLVMERECASVRVEVLIPRELVIGDDEWASLRRLREVATGLLIKRGENNRSVKRSWHAFYTPAVSDGRPPCADDERCSLAMHKVSCKLCGDVVSLGLVADGFLRGMAWRCAALVIAKLRGWPCKGDPWCESALFADFGPPPPAYCEVLAEATFPKFETRHKMRLDALRLDQDDEDRLAADAFRNKVIQHAPLAPLLDYWRRAELFFKEHEVVVERLLTVARAAPPYYQAALAALRGLSDDDWPSTTPARQRKINGGGGSFTIGSVAAHATQHNLTQPALVKAIFDLEVAIIANCELQRSPSTMCAVNLGAKFKVHLDAGSAGEGQSTSLFVALGDFTGGELVVESTCHDCLYSPLEFDGWRKRHWTRPFTGQRFSLVWFSPNLQKNPPKTQHDPGTTTTPYQSTNKKNKKTTLATGEEEGAHHR